MQAKPRQLTEPTLLTVSTASYYQAPSNKRVMITKVTVSNTDTANARTFDDATIESLYARVQNFLDDSDGKR